MVAHYLQLLLVCDKMPKDMFYVMYALRDRYSMDQVPLQIETSNTRLNTKEIDTSTRKKEDGF